MFIVTFIQTLSWIFVNSIADFTIIAFTLSAKNTVRPYKISFFIEFYVFASILENVYIGCKDL